MPPLIAIVVFLLAGIAGTVVLRRAFPAPGDGLARGLAHLAELRWREFARVVLEAMRARGYTVVRDDDGHADGLPTEGGDLLLERDGQRALLSCKYGNASVVGAAPILGLGKSAELRGASSAIVVTPGRFDDEARRVAARQNVELIDGTQLWPEVSPFLEPYDDEPDAAPEPGRGRVLALAWGAAAVLAGVAWLLANAMAPAPPVDAATTPLPPQAPRAAAQATPPQPAALPAPVPTDPALLEQRRAAAARAISTLPGVDRAVWASRSTLVVHMASGDADPRTGLCVLLERYPELAASRVQLQPPHGSTEAVRFRQCRAY